MNIACQTFIIFLCATLSITYIHCQETQSTQSIIVKKLKKAWENNWVKAGTITTACALIYALGVNLNVINPSVMCTGTANCHACNKASQIGPNYKLLWKVIGIMSGLIACGFGYKYYTSQDDQENQSDDNENGNIENNASTTEFNDDFFEFPDDQLESEIPMVTTITTSSETSSTPDSSDTKVEPTIINADEINEPVTQIHISDIMNASLETEINNEELSFI